jgi:FlaA1/EpsC-like NDP-sugar epimerase
VSQLVVDAGLIAFAYYLAFWLRFEDQPHGMPDNYHRLLVVTGPWVVIGTVVILAASRVYQRRWRDIGQRDIERLAVALAIAAVLPVTIVAVVHPALPDAVALVYCVLALVFLIGVRRLVSAIANRRWPGRHAPREHGNGPVMP